jgi:hypothetical protein
VGRDRAREVTRQGRPGGERGAEMEPYRSAATRRPSPSPSPSLEQWSRGEERQQRSRRTNMQIVRGLCENNWIAIMNRDPNQGFLCKYSDRDY